MGTRSKQLGDATQDDQVLAAETGRTSDVFGRDMDADMAARSDLDVPVGTTAAPAQDADGEVELAAIESQIDQTRMQMTGTLNAIEQRLRPENVVQQAKETVREATVGRVEDMMDRANESVRSVTSSAGQTGGGLLATVRDNPIPAALAAIGIGWLWMKRGTTQSSTYRYGAYEETYGYGPGSDAYSPQYGATSGGPGVTDQARERAGEIAENVRGTAGSVAGQVGDTAGQVGDRISSAASDMPYRVQETARTAQERMGDFMQQNPLAAGAAALAAGAVVGLMVPATQRERELMGPARERVIEQAGTAVEHAAERVQQAAEEVQTSTSDEAAAERTTATV